ncbi:MAG: lamin tail domain-containing protein [Bacteroidales bacterium]|nr:lamin tail domain-containing protein [Bacteroidales bacterium]
MKKTLLTAMMTICATFLMAQDCSDLFFSEYVEGSANNKALEIYNPTNNPIDLGLYVIKRYSNGSPFPTEALPLSGILQPKQTIVVTNGQTDSVWVPNGSYWSLPISQELYNIGDFHCSGIYPTPMYFNGDDALTLETVTGGVIDIFGKIGEQPENGWNNIPPSYTAGSQYWTSWTVDQTLIRKPSVKQGVKSNPALFMVHMEWDSLPRNTFDSLGFHTCDCASSNIWENQSNQHSFIAYPNPVVGNILKMNASAHWITIEIQNIVGQTIITYHFDGSARETSLYVPDLKAGVFFVKIFFADKTTAVQKIIKR